jgi:hypothetical protein
MGRELCVDHCLAEIHLGGVGGRPACRGRYAGKGVWWTVAASVGFSGRVRVWALRKGAKGSDLEIGIELISVFRYHHPQYAQRRTQRRRFMKNQTLSSAERQILSLQNE